MNSKLNSFKEMIKGKKFKVTSMPKAIKLVMPQ